MNPKQAALETRKDAIRGRPRARNFQRPAETDETPFPIAIRGYDRQAVDEYVEEMNRYVADLNAARARQNAVREAIDQVGEETSSILQHAHETADGITNRARAEARERIDEAEREARETRSAAETHARRLAHDTENVRHQRTELLDDMRKLAEQLLEVADSAHERLQHEPPPISTVPFQAAVDGAIPPPPPPGDETSHPAPPADAVAGSFSGEDHGYDEDDEEGLEEGESGYDVEGAVETVDEDDSQRFVPPPDRTSELDRPTEAMDALSRDAIPPRAFRASRGTGSSAHMRWPS